MAKKRPFDAEDVAASREAVLEIAREMGRWAARQDYEREQAARGQLSPRVNQKSDRPRSRVRNVAAT